MPREDTFVFHTGREDEGKRLDQVISAHLKDLSRSHIAALIRKGQIRVEDKEKKPAYRIRFNDRISGTITFPELISIQPEAIELSILYADRHMIVIDKAPGLVVHPSPGHYSGTLVHALLHHFPRFSDFEEPVRPGIVHRLDKDTSGVLVVAGNPIAQLKLSEQFKNRKIKKTYLALVSAIPSADSGTASMPIGRHPVDRKKMAALPEGKGRAAETRWRVMERYASGALLKIELLTGRTHQIRVHCAALGMPIIGDPIYGQRKSAKIHYWADRQMLHAWRLGLYHPENGRFLTFEAPIAKDMAETIGRMRIAHPPDRKC